MKLYKITFKDYDWGDHWFAKFVWAENEKQVEEMAKNMGCYRSDPNCEIDTIVEMVPPDKPGPLNMREVHKK